MRSLQWAQPEWFQRVADRSRIPSHCGDHRELFGHDPLVDCNLGVAGVTWLMLGQHDG